MIRNPGGIFLCALALSACSDEQPDLAQSELPAQPPEVNVPSGMASAPSAAGSPSTSEAPPPIVNEVGGAPDEPPAASSIDSGVALGPDAAAEAPDSSVAPELPPAVEDDDNLPPGVVSRFPRGAANGVCRDAPLRLRFENGVTLGNTGRISIFASAAPGTALDVVDMAATAFPDTIAARPVNRVRPVFLEGSDAVVYFRHDILQPDTSYFVTVDAGVFVGQGGAPLAAIADRSWTFTTGSPQPGAGTLVVQREGQGNFCTVQGALDAVPANNTSPVRIELRDGSYHEMLYVTRKANVTLTGESRDGTLITYPNNNTLNAGTAGRSMVTAVTMDNLVIENLTLYNTTPQGGSQAEALFARGNQVILRNSSFRSLQDTLLLDGRVYVVDSYVEGNVDFVWGSGTAYFERSEIKIVGRSGVIVQSRNPATAAGYVFVDSRFTSDPGITNSTFARIDVTTYPASHVALIDCQVGPHISPAGWTVTPAGTTATDQLRFWEYQSTNLQGQPLDVGQRHPASRQMTPAEAATMRDHAALHGGWDPTR